MALLFELFMSAATEWFTGKLVDWLIALYEGALDLLQSSFFTHSFVIGVLNFFELIGAGMLLIGLLKALFTEMEKRMHGEGFAIGDRLFDFLKAYGLLVFCHPVVLLAHEFTIELSTLITSGLDIRNGVITALDAVRLSTTLMSTVMVIIALVCTVGILINIFKQYAIMFTQILTGYLYVFDVAAGNSGAIGEWGRDVIGGRIAFAVQLMFYKLGMVELANALQSANMTNMIFAGVFLVGASMVPTALKRWGYANQTSGGAFGRFVQTAAMVLPRMI